MKLKQIKTKVDPDNPKYIRIYVGNQLCGRAIPSSEFSLFGDVYIFQSYLDIIQSETNPKTLIQIYSHINLFLNRFLNDIIND